jgi:predicted NBD/HSP70 family sugar kinase
MKKANKHKQSLVLGVDIGGTKIAAGLVDFEGRVTGFLQEPTKKRALLPQLEKLIEKYKGFSAIGLGFPGKVSKEGTISRASNLPMRNVRLKHILEGRFKVPVSIENDAKSFAYAESVLGAGKNIGIVVGLIWGTGIGAGVIINGEIYYGKDGIAGEFGQFLMPNNNTLEQLIKSAGTFRSAKSAERYLKLILNYICLSLNPEVIVLGGAVSRLSGMEAVARKIIKNVRYPSVTTEVKVSKLAHAGVIGAALLALKN